MKIECPFQKIDIIEATVTDGKCDASSDTQVADTCCSDEGATLAVDRFCQGKKKCEFSATSEFLGEPCIDGTKYVNVKYHCTDEKEAEAEVSRVAMVQPSSLALFPSFTIMALKTFSMIVLCQKLSIVS